MTILNSKTTLVNDDGFLPSTPFSGSIHDIFPGDDHAQTLPKMHDYAMIRIHFEDFSDGRGFSIARQLREQGYNGHLRAYGHVIADQYTMARRSGFDDVEISAALAARQTAAQWKFRSNWQDNDYQSRLRGA